jgi:hypothetical protein
MVTKDWAVCPLCWANHKIDKTGKYHYSKKGEPIIEKDPSTLSFGRFDLEDNDFILVRDCSGGYGRAGFPVVERLSIKEAINSKKYNFLFNQIDSFCQKWQSFRKKK